MNAWVETAAGNLVSGASMAIITRRNEITDSWEVCIAASSLPSVFAEGLVGRPEAQTVRNALAMALTRASGMGGTPVISFDGGSAVQVTDLEA